MENNNENIVDSTLDLMSDAIGAFDHTLGKTPIYKSGHNLGGFISQFINKVVDAIPDKSLKR